MADHTVNQNSVQEQWRLIRGYEHYYVSNLGRVRSQAQSKPRILRPGLASNGYQTVNLWRGNKGRSHTVHSLVADAFLGAGRPDDVVDHIDRDRGNNRADNLRRVSRKTNAECHAKTYTLISPEGQTVTVHNLSSHCRRNGLNRSSMGAVISGLMKQHKGWRAHEDTKTGD